MKKPTGLLNRITYILLAIFITASIFATLQKGLQTTGLVIALIINLIIAGILLRKTEKGSPRRIIGVTMISTIIIISLTVLILMTTISQLISGALN